MGDVRNGRGMVSHLRRDQGDPALTLRRVNRKLAKAGERVIKSRGRAVQDLGEYARVDLTTNAVVETDVDLHALDA